METVVRALMLAVLLAATGAAAGTIYKSTASDGSVVYSDHSPADGGKVDKVISFDDLPSSPVPPPPQGLLSGRSTEATQPALAKPAENAKVRLYVASWCPYCRRAKAWLAQRHIPYEAIDIESEIGRMEFQVEARGGGIPYLVRGSRHIRGFEEEGYDTFFASR